VLACRACAERYRRTEAGFWDFRRGMAFADWFTRDSAAQEQFRAGGARCEHVGSERLVADYLIPLLGQLGLPPGRTKVLSDGCGIGADVEQLRTAGYLAWGGDPGSRSDLWMERAARPFLMHFNGSYLPFADGSFDFVFSEGVIEHVGLRSDAKPAVEEHPRIERERALYCAEMHRVLRPGGYALIAAPNRLFPIDFFHGGKPALGLSIRFHPPTEFFLASVADVARWFGPFPCSWRTLSMRGFFNTSVVAQRGVVGRGIELLWNAATTLLPPAALSLAGPYFLMLIRKHHD
jgi:SAM-dependent methyltransferase